MFGAASSYFMNWFQSHMGTWRAQDKRLRGDNWEDDISIFLASFEDDVNEMMFNETTIGFDFDEYVNRILEAMFIFNSGELARQIEQALGERVYGGTLWWEQVKGDWINLLKNGVRKGGSFFVRKLQREVFRAVQQDVPFDEIVELVYSQVKNLTINQARNLAKDLVGTLNAQIMKNLHASIGIDMYRWQTQVDERVRGRPGGLYPKAIPSHWMMEGILCLWANPTVYSLDGGKTWINRTDKMPKVHTGEDFGCRCLPVGAYRELVQEIDNEGDVK